MKMNQKATQPKITTHEGGRAYNIDAKRQIERTIMACMLWEKNFYESGQEVAERIQALADQLPDKDLIDLAVKAREEQKLRHAPLLLVLAMVKRGGPLVSWLIARVCTRPDQLPELLALYLNGTSRGTGPRKKPLSHQLKLGFAKALENFDEYQMAKWEGSDDKIKLRDILRLCRAKPPKGREDLYARLRAGTLARPDTWESRSVAGENKKELFTDLLTRGKLPYMALLRNLRSMVQAGVDEKLIRAAILNPAPSVLPFRFIAAATAAPMFSRELEAAMMKTLEGLDKLDGPTALLVDVSGSMRDPLSEKSDLTRGAAAAALAMLLSGVCDDLRVFTFSYTTREVQPLKGFGLANLVVPRNEGTKLGLAVNNVLQAAPGRRLIVITDEQSQDRVPQPPAGSKAYMLNVACNRNGVGYGNWVHIDGFSEACIQFIMEYESASAR